MQVQRGDFDSLAENQLPDGSRILVDHKNETVYALNATAGAAWDACSVPTSLDNVTEELQRSFGPDVTKELAEEAIVQLQNQNLVTASGGERRPTRREILTKFGKVALPIVVAMTLTEQTEHAAYASSAKGGGSQGGSGSSNPCSTLIGYLTHPQCW